MSGRVRQTITTTQWLTMTQRIALRQTHKTWKTAA
jgi:hypothetical protein